MTRPLYRVALSPRENGPIPAPSVARDVWDVIQIGFLCFVYFVLIVLLLGGF